MTPMQRIERLYAFPHEMLHVLALRLIGRKPERVARMHVDIPDDLSKRQYVFVAGLPTAVFVLIWAVGVVALMRADDLLQIALALVVSLFGGLGAAGGMGDINLIFLRLQEDERR